MLPPPLRPRAHVLVVDDDAGVREVCTTLLHALGYRAEAAASGEKAVETLVANDASVAAVLLDLDMPTMTGDRVLELVKAARPHVRVLMMSGRARDDLRGYLARGADGVLRKPFGLSDLGQCLDSVLRA